jgi:hypothetical protein
MSRAVHRVDAGEAVTDDPPPDEALPSPEALALLTDETRRAIVEALWAAGDPPLPFSALRRQSGVDESARFNYHLTQLLGRYVREADDGYELTRRGEQFVGALRAVPTLGDGPDAGARPSD